MLRDENLFIQNGYEKDGGECVEEITFGNYYENEDQYMQAMLKSMQGMEGVKVGSSAMGNNLLSVNNLSIKPNTTPINTVN